MSTTTFHKVKLTKTVSHKEEILEYILYNRVLGNTLTSNEIIYKIWSI